MRIVLLPFLVITIWGGSVTFSPNDVGSASNDELLAGISWRTLCCSSPEGSRQSITVTNKDFTGNGGDAAAREDMFGSKVSDLLMKSESAVVTGQLPAFNEDHPLFRVIREMISVRKQNPTLQRGIQMVRYADEKPGIFAVSRIDRERREEMLAVFNNSGETEQSEHQSLIRRRETGNAFSLRVRKE